MIDLLPDEACGRTTADEDGFATIKSRGFICRLPIAHTRQRAARTVVAHPAFIVVTRAAVGERGVHRHRRCPWQRSVRVSPGRMQAHDAVFLAFGAGQIPGHSPGNASDQQLRDRPAEDRGEGESLFAGVHQMGGENNVAVAAHRCRQLGRGRRVVNLLIQLHVEHHLPGFFRSQEVHQLRVQVPVPGFANTLLEVIIRRLVHFHQHQLGEAARVVEQRGEIETQSTEASAKIRPPEEPTRQNGDERAVKERSRQSAVEIAERHGRCR